MAACSLYTGWNQSQDCSFKITVLLSINWLWQHELWAISPSPLSINKNTLHYQIVKDLSYTADKLSMVDNGQQLKAK